MSAYYNEHDPAAAAWLRELIKQGHIAPGTFPLVNGAPARVGRLRGYGNAINAEVAATFVAAYGGVV